MGMRALARNRDFSRLWVGQALSKLGSRGTALALPLLILPASKLIVSLNGFPAVPSPTGSTGAPSWSPATCSAAWGCAPWRSS